MHDQYIDASFTTPRIVFGCGARPAPMARRTTTEPRPSALSAASILDTGDFYGIGRNEMLVGQALRGAKRDRALLSVKFGALRGPDGAFHGYDASPAAVKNSLAHSLARLGVDYIDIYRPARLDSKVPIEDTIGAIAEMVKAGYVRHIALSEVGPETIARAAKVHPIVDLQEGTITLQQVRKAMNMDHGLD
jgi:aryl-alcohol dehydrogenase-like predicted oxidoreductase